MELNLLSSKDLVGCNIVQLRSAAFGIYDFILVIGLGCNFLTIRVLDDEIKLCGILGPGFKESQAFWPHNDVMGSRKSESVCVLIG